MSWRGQKRVFGIIRHGSTPKTHLYARAYCFFGAPTGSVDGKLALSLSKNLTCFQDQMRRAHAHTVNASKTQVDEDAGYPCKNGSSISGAEVQADTMRFSASSAHKWWMMDVREAISALENLAVWPSEEDLVSILSNCKKTRNLLDAKLFFELVSGRLDAYKALANCFVQTFVQCGSVTDAQQVFSRLAHRNEYSWTSLMGGYMNMGDPSRVLELFEEMQGSCVQPLKFTLLHATRACAKLKCLDWGQKVHTQIAEEGYEEDQHVGCVLVDMYVKCGLLEEARMIFEELQVRDVINWTVLLEGYAERGLSEEALRCFYQMQKDGMSADAAMFVCCLKACRKMGSVCRGRELHAEIAKQGFDEVLNVGNTLIDMYARCGSLIEARKVFQSLSHRDVVSWNTLAAGYTEHNLYEETLVCFQSMLSQGVYLDTVTCVLSLKACIGLGSIDNGRMIHTEIMKVGLELDLFVGNTTLDMYVKCGSLTEAWNLFKKLPARDVVTWNTLIVGLIEYGFNEDMLSCLQEMQLEEISPNYATFVCILKAFGSKIKLSGGQEVHTQIIKRGLEREKFVGNTLVDMYAKCQSLAEAQKVFGELQAHDIVSWNALIAGHLEHGHDEEALSCFQEMLREGLLPDAMTLACVLKASGNMDAIQKCQALHTCVVIEGLDGDCYIGSTLVALYSNHGLLREAQDMSSKMSIRDEHSWNALVSGYVEYDLPKEGLKCFRAMKGEGVLPHAVTYVSALKACAKLGALTKGLELHSEVAQEGFEDNPFICSILVDMYCKCGSLVDAREVLDEVLVPNVVTWTAMIAGYAEHGLVEKAQHCFERMQMVGLSPDVILCNTMISSYAEQGQSERSFEHMSTLLEQGIMPDSSLFASTLKACGDIGSLGTGKKIHALLYDFKVKANETVLSNALIDMYSKCGSILDAQQVFDVMSNRGLASWNALMTGHAHQGDSELVASMFRKMRDEGIYPDAITFVSVLNACSHGGLIEKGQECFETMIREFGIAPTIKHHNCMIDLFGRAGQLGEVAQTVEVLPFEPDLVVSSTVLSACRNWEDAGFGREAFNFALALNLVI